MTETLDMLERSYDLTPEPVDCPGEANHANNQPETAVPTRSKVPELVLMSGLRHVLEQKAYRTWRQKGNCSGVDPEVFFPGTGESTRLAKEICVGCTVVDDCLEYALANKEKFGVWGGTSERQRRRIVRLRKLASAGAST